MSLVRVSDAHCTISSSHRRRGRLKSTSTAAQTAKQSSKSDETRDQLRFGRRGSHHSSRCFGEDAAWQALLRRAAEACEGRRHARAATAAHTRRREMHQRAPARTGETHGTNAQTHPSTRPAIYRRHTIATTAPNTHAYTRGTSTARHAQSTTHRVRRAAATARTTASS